jgi:uncharacterized protein YlbG (UPF0298 family)
VYSVSAGDSFKYRDINERRDNKLDSFQTMKNLNLCDEQTLNQQFRRVKEYLYSPIEVINSQDQFDNVKFNNSKKDYMVLYSPDSDFMDKKKFEFQVNYIDDNFSGVDGNSISDVQILFTSNP